MWNRGTALSIFLLWTIIIAKPLPAQVPARYDIVIDEIMADPSPVVGLPNSEFIELKNVSAHAYDLVHWKISDGNSTATIAVSFQLKPDSFVIICPTANVVSFSAFGATIGVSNFPSINNDMDVISLLSAEGMAVHAVNFSSEWFNNALKSEGGWTLEMIDPRNPCSGGENWKASIDVRGGTPGMENSVNGIFNDHQPPVLLRCYVPDSTTVVAIFNEPIDSISGVTISNYSVEGNALIVSNLIVTPPLFNEVKLRMATAFTKGRIYVLRITGIADCSGNVIGQFNNSAFAIPVETDTSDFIINEILFNPAAGGVDYVELYNRSNKVFDASKIFIANRNGVGNIASIRKASDYPRLIFPGDYITLTEDTRIVDRQYHVKKPEWLLGVNNFPSFPDDAGTVVILNESGKIIDELHYDEQMHFALIKNRKGVSLERIDPSVRTSARDNWTSAASIANFGTPTERNSQFRQGAGVVGMISIDPPVFSPDNDGYNDVCFIYYQMDEPNQVANITVFDVQGRPVRKLYTNCTLSLQGYLKWDGLGDGGKELLVGVYLIYAEVFNLNGKSKSFKNVVVLAKKF